MLIEGIDYQNLKTGCSTNFANTLLQMAAAGLVILADVKAIHPRRFLLGRRFVVAFQTSAEKLSRSRPLALSG